MLQRSPLPGQSFISEQVRKKFGRIIGFLVEQAQPMALFRTHIPEFSAFLQNLSLPPHQFAGAICRDRASALPGSLFSLCDGPGSVLDPARCTFDQTPISRRTERPCQTPMGLCPLCLPEWIVAGPLVTGSP